MNEITGREPALPQDSALTGREPGLGGERREKPGRVGRGVLRQITFTFVPVREQTTLEILRMFQRGDALLVSYNTRRILLQSYLYRGDTIQHRDSGMPRVTIRYVGWASEEYPATASDQVHHAEVGPDLDSFELSISVLSGFPSYYFSDTV